MGATYLGGNKVGLGIVSIIPYPGYRVIINNNDTAHQKVTAQLEPLWKTTEYDETFIAGAENVGVKLHLYINSTASGYAHGALSWSPNTFVNGGMLTSGLTVNVTDATPIQDVVIPTGYEDYYLKNNISNFYNDTNYDSYKSRTQLTGKVIVFDLNNWLPSQTSVNMQSMFHECTNITELDVSNLNTSKVTSLYYTFRSCSSLTSLDLSNWNTSNVTTMYQTFFSSTNLTSLNVSNWDTSKVTNMYGTFGGCRKLESLNISNWNVSNVTVMESLFHYLNTIKTLDLSNWDTSKVTNMSSMFSQCSLLTSLDVSNFDTSKVTNMSSMFTQCSLLTSLDVSNFDTSKVTSMSSFTNGCNKLGCLIIASPTFKFQLKTSISLPTNCKILVPQSLISTYQSATNWSTHSSKFDAIENYVITRSNGQVSVSQDFSSYVNVTESDNLTSKYLNNWAINTADFSNLETVSGEKAMYDTFDGCQNLFEVNFPKLRSISGYLVLNSIFYNCPNLTTVSFPLLSTIEGSSAIAGAFYGNTNLTDIYFPALTSSSFGSTYTNQFSNLFNSTSGSVSGEIKVHFPSNLQTTISGLTSYPYFGGNSDRIKLVYDLPATS